ncbi:formate dehydrogenase accessory sulfurtransferase FdhD [Bradyrhizobium sp. CB2312]|uniref:formate dehydrogenase accessory sulfurtransferase FdhD n=1 Tax=Bradyrhizobium sp. CB2312 TaxID=3039155 RepID=UPI0024B04388|nr:formate dehydrogenase accessory sulfurtransferase FdhD [Bradyrhizobium sp. CB2312]WFU73421.1 formate dehydrogenase accessory sulfurtransferase FdhD [Bradyrhizobium sp. CB2312]
MSSSVSTASHVVDRQAWRGNRVSQGTRSIPEERPLALTYNGGTYAVMMGTPCDLEDFAIGFSLSASNITRADEVESLEIVEVENGTELRMWLTPARAGSLSERRRIIAGPTGCGLCGVESIAEALKAPPDVGTGAAFSSDQIIDAIGGIASLQTLNTATRAVHAAAFWTPKEGIVALREDVGRHNALDKLAGALARGSVRTENGMVLLTSRVSVELVQKTAMIGASVMVAVSVPTALATRTAEAAGITLVAVARDDGFEVFTHPHRVSFTHTVRSISQ